MACGGCNYNIHGVYKPTNVTVGHHPVWNCGRPLTESFGRLPIFLIYVLRLAVDQDDIPNVFC